MPSVTIAPPLASSAARRIAADERRRSVTVWSAGVIASTGSPPSSSAASAASVNAGAVLRPDGFEQQRGVGDAYFAQLLEQQEPVLIVAHDQRRRGPMLSPSSAASRSTAC